MSKEAIFVFPLIAISAIVAYKAWPFVVMAIYMVIITKL